MTDYSNLSHEELMALAKDMPALSDEERVALQARLETLIAQYKQEKEDLEAKYKRAVEERERRKRALAELDKLIEEAQQEA